MRIAFLSFIIEHNEIFLCLYAVQQNISCILLWKLLYLNAYIFTEYLHRSYSHTTVLIVY